MSLFQAKNLIYYYDAKPRPPTKTQNMFWLRNSHISNFFLNIPHFTKQDFLLFRLDTQNLSFLSIEPMLAKGEGDYGEKPLKSNKILDIVFFPKPHPNNI